MTNTSAQKKLHLSTSLNYKGVRFLGTQEKDMVAYYKAHLLGAFDIIGIPHGITLDEFRQCFADYLRAVGCTSVTFYTKVDGADLPVGVGIMWIRGRIIQNENLIWFPWASPRNILEGAINYFDTFRLCKESISGAYYKVLEFAQEKDVKFFDRLVQMGILERVGVINDLYLDKQECTLYVTKEVT